MTEAKLSHEAEWTVNTLRKYFEAILDEQRRGTILAEAEREKAAAALRDALARNIEEGDRNLRDHIENQIMQIRAALTSADQLETSRMEIVQNEIEAVQRELVIAMKNSDTAVGKAEEAVQRRLDLLNEFRAQIADEAQKYAQREVVDAQVNELKDRIVRLEQRISELL